MADERANQEIPVYIPPAVTAQRSDNPTKPVTDAPGLRTEWDASTLDGAVSWLEEHAAFLGEWLLPTMQNDIKDRLTGPPGSAAPPFGSFPTAIALSDRHLGHYTRAEGAVQTVAEQLWQTAQALREVKEKYETAEQANRMSAAAFDQLFAAEASSSSGRYDLTGA
ncbi:hypothetical protein [Catenuloplanes japonicus]|uniref:hypothetical protein n=1 Tax=Catenuloplanes japonicus TaxID=33876 RepID=UPI00068BE5D6|nr:hypothetical protein [Catenuloplanes japonicus]